jgi:Utp11 protein
VFYTDVLAEVLRNDKSATRVVVSQQGMSKEARELEARMARVKELEKMLRKVTLQVQLMENGAVRKIRKEEDDSDDEEDTIPTYKWKPRRQK